MRFDEVHEAIADYAISQPSKACKLADALKHCVDQGYERANEVDQDALKNSLRQRGLMLKDGMIAAWTFRPASEIRPKPRAYGTFVKNARQRIEDAKMPIPSVELIPMDAVMYDVPQANMAIVLHEAGLFHIPGLGWWTDPTYVDDKGRVYMIDKKGKLIALLADVFSQYGWPIRQQQIQALTHGQLNLGYLNTQRTSVDPYAVNIGSTLMVPAIECTKHRVPMSSDVATLVEHMEGELLTFQEDPTLFKLAKVMEAAGWATVKASMTTRDKITRRTIRYQLTEEGRAGCSNQKRVAPNEQEAAI